MDIEDLCKEKEGKDRIAIIDPYKCKPDKCGKECIKICPVNRQGKICIDLEDFVPTPGEKSRKIASIAESLCTGCGLCVKMCPFSAIKIVNIPKGLKKDIAHRYGPNAFKLHKLPNIKSGQITGILGQNGLGKSTILNIFEQNIEMNLGNFEADRESMDKAILKRFRGTDIQKIIANKIRTQLKPQNINRLRQDITVRDYLDIPVSTEETETNNEEYGDLTRLLDRSMLHISGGELQRVIIRKICTSDSDLYMFDEPTSFFDLKQRVEMANTIQDIVQSSKKYVLVVDHDVNILDYVSDQLVILYGARAAYGICATPLPIGQGINSYFEGYLQKDNVRFRKVPFRFETPENTDDIFHDHTSLFSYDEIIHQLGDFELTLKPAEFSNHGITVLLGENGAGKTTFVNIVSDLSEKTNTIVSTKSQYIDQSMRPYRSKSVRVFLGDKIFQSPFLEISKKLDIPNIMESRLRSLSGGELQKVMILKCVMQDADIYLFDEPSAFLDTETRIIVSKIIKDYFFEKSALVFVIDHDMLMTTYLADYAILFEGEPGSKMVANPPVPIKEGMNAYLENLGITMRVDQSSRRRLNKLNSTKDREQKMNGEYY
jgi:ATP-binding cassette, sub-family E, member 1